ncbi:MAG: glycosyltransferase family 4 protein [Actinomycetota bacterium]
MRILQVVSDTDRRGAQVFATDLAEALEARGHQVETVALVPGACGGLGVEALGGPGSRWWSRRVLRSLRDRMAGADVTVAHGSSAGPACALAGLGTRRPVVYRQISDSRFWAPTRLKRRRVRATLAAGRLVVALSEFNRAELVDWIGVPPERIVVIPNGAPAARFSPATPAQRAAARAGLGLPARPGVPVVAYVGALAPEKGVDLAVRAVGRLANAHLVVAGTGDEAERLEQLADAVAPGRVWFAGSMTDAVPAYHAADVVLLPSRGGDAMPAVLIEAGLCGRPVVSTAVGAIPEVVVDGETGYVVVPDDLDGITDRVGRVLRDPARRDAMGAAGRTRCLARYEIGPVAQAWDAALVRATSA